MIVRKYCQCGVKLDRYVINEAAARQAVDVFRAAHSGYGHGPVSKGLYDKTISMIIKRQGQRKGKRRRGGQRKFREL